jgi:SARP family transcriptional regulator, regulator of embCAB operon
MMKISILGCLEVSRGGASIVPSAAKPRTVLAVLAVRASTAVPVRTLAEELWGVRPPNRAATALQTYVLQIRNLIAALPELGQREEAKQVLAHERGGYRLRADGGAVDVEQFEWCAAAGRRALARREYAAAADYFHDALRRWRGIPLVDVVAGPLLSAEVARLEAARLEALSGWFEAELRLGRYSWRIGDLAALSARHPAHERMNGLYMIALLAAGRRDRALEVYHRLRRTLAQEFGIEPSPACRRIQHLVLGTPAGRDGPRQALDELAV